ncbi:MAG: neutral zinc metallopeptidase [Micropruina sp.]|uniref:neutral zinc metallopeptidase n=1 Tax=Micropruina sp. TaxID=2737536 RepID=UPI0039E62416
MTVGLPRRDGPDPAHLPPRVFGSPAPIFGAPSGASFGVRPPLPQPPRRPAGPGRFAVVLLLLVGLVIAGLQTMPMFGTAPVEPTSRTPARSSTAATPSSRPGDPLTDSALYPLRVGGSCPASSAVSNREAYTKQVGELLNCLEGIFRPLIEQAGGDFSTVRHTFYARSTDSPCGRETEAYAFYCTDNDTIYFSDQVYKDSEYGRLVLADVVIHEYGHHMQDMMGMFDAAERLSESRAVTTRREELQVFCWTYYVFAALPSFKLTVDDHSYFRDVWNHTDDAEGHGSVKAQQYWGARGLEADNLGACNTWAVPAERVR